MDVSRNWGFITAEEQELLGAVKIAVAGAGGDGGLVALHLARLGLRHFAIADTPSSSRPKTPTGRPGATSRR
jgi:tRNA threonylcarbamoyladenosine dehydratase